MTFWLTKLLVFLRRCCYKVSLYCHTVHGHARPGLWMRMKLAARHLASNFSPSFFLMLKEWEHDWETRSPKYLSCILAYMDLQFSWVSQIQLPLYTGEVLWLFKRKGEHCSMSKTADKIPPNGDAVAIPYSSYFQLFLEIWALFPTNLYWTSLLRFCIVLVSLETWSIHHMPENKVHDCGGDIN